VTQLDSSTERKKPLLLQLFDDAQLAKKIWETVSWGISAAGTVMAFVTEVGGVQQFLIEVFAFGFAAYIAAFPAVAVMAGVVWLFERARMQPTDKATIGFLVTLVLIFGALIRFSVFHEGVTRDLDVVGSTFASLVGLAILLTPVGLYLRRYKHHFVQPMK
jgi:hypothetical protein